MIISHMLKSSEMNILKTKMFFFTDEKDEVQFGILNYKKGFKTGAHYHGHAKAKKNGTDQILIVQKGSARIDFYSEKGEYILSSTVSTGDIVIIYRGGHNILYLEDSRIYIIKPGVYDSATDKMRIVGANNTDLIVEN